MFFLPQVFNFPPNKLMNQLNVDIDECNGADRICFGLCENSVGSFNCSCSAGYKLNTENKTLLSCEDIDECKFSTDNNCDQVCVDNEGSYNCTCKSGFKLGNDGSSCVVKTENKCDSTNGGCERLCTNSSGTVTCHCPRGFNLSSDGKSCMDVNECLTSNGGCSQNCTNYDGSYNCSCRSGYKLKGARMCEGLYSLKSHYSLNSGSSSTGIPRGPLRRLTII
ncbi:Hemicentin-2 [Exaiptasia diaphana]|nr:Hemicentin-2 [Exaiptasia diaphana]